MHNSSGDCGVSCGGSTAQRPQTAWESHFRADCARLQNLCGVATPRSVGSTPAPLRQAVSGVLARIVACSSSRLSERDLPLKSAQDRWRAVKTIARLSRTVWDCPGRVRRPRRAVIAPCWVMRLWDPDVDGTGGWAARSLPLVGRPCLQAPAAFVRSEAPDACQKGL
jgi:hypothetical protein